MDTKCYTCGKPIKRKPSRLAKFDNHYCSRHCMAKGYRLKYERSKVAKGSCTHCGKPVYKNPAKDGFRLFCNDNCYKSWRGVGPSAKSICVNCGNVFYKSPKSKQTACSKDCGYTAYSKRKTTEIICKNCGKLFRRINSQSGRISIMLCSPKCYTEYNKMDTSFSWKGGSYKCSQGCIMILIGRYTYITNSKTHKNLKYKRRHRVIAEIYLGYDLDDSARILMLHGSEKTDNLYICQNQSEYLRIIYGSLPMPATSNLNDIKKNQFYKSVNDNYERLPDEWISKIVLASLRISPNA